MLQQMYKQQVNKGFKNPQLPTLVLYSAAQSVTKVNGLDPEKTLKNRYIIQNATLKFIQDIAPEIAPFTKFWNDEELENRHEIVKPTIQYLINIFEEGVAKGEVDEGVVNFLNKKENYLQSMGYMVEHSLYASDNLGFPLVSLFAKGNKLLSLRSGDNPQNLIMMGGESENLFYEIRQYLIKKSNLDDWLVAIKESPEISEENCKKAKEIINNSKLKRYIQDKLNQQKRVQIITSVGAIPAYQPPSSDIKIDTLLVETFQQKLEKLKKRAAKGSRVEKEIIFDTDILLSSIPDQNLEEKLSRLKAYFQA